MDRQISILLVTGMLLCLAACGCKVIGDQRQPSLSSAQSVEEIEARWSEPINLWNLNTEREEKRPYITPDGNTLFLPGRVREGYIRVAKWTGDMWSDPVEEKKTSPAGSPVAAYTRDGKMVFFMGKGLIQGPTPPELPSFAKADADIYYATRENDHWSEPINMGPEVNSPTLEEIPSVTADGNIVYFDCGRREGNFGNADIWRTRRVGGVYQKAEHLGPQINTIGDEYCAWISADGHVLYFGRSRSTGGRIGQGEPIDQHIWMCHIDNNGVPDEPVKLGPKFNVPGYSSCCVTMSADGKRLVYASNRPGGKGSWDFWMVTRR